MKTQLNFQIFYVFFQEEAEKKKREYAGKDDVWEKRSGKEQGGIKVFVSVRAAEALKILPPLLRLQ